MQPRRGRRKREPKGFLLQTRVSDLVGARVQEAADKDEISIAALLRRLVHEKFGNGEKPTELKATG